MPSRPRLKRILLYISLLLAAECGLWLAGRYSERGQLAAFVALEHPQSGTQVWLRQDGTGARDVRLLVPGCTPGEADQLEKATRAMLHLQRSQGDRVLVEPRPGTWKNLRMFFLTAAALAGAVLLAGVDTLAGRLSSLQRSRAKSLLRIGAGVLVLGSPIFGVAVSLHLLPTLPCTYALAAFTAMVLGRRQRSSGTFDGSDEADAGLRGFSSVVVIAGLVLLLLSGREVLTRTLGPESIANFKVTRRLQNQADVALAGLDTQVFACYDGASTGVVIAFPGIAPEEVPAPQELRERMGLPVSQALVLIPTRLHDEGWSGLNRWSIGLLLSVLTGVFLCRTKKG